MRFERTYKLRPWHRYENVIIAAGFAGVEGVESACGGFIFRWSGRLTTRLAMINLYPVETRRVR